MKMGRTAKEALEALVSTDTGKNVRQVAMVDIHGNVAAHTGEDAIYAAGHHVGKGYSVQANLMENPTVWDAMAKAYESSEGDLAERLLCALEAAQAEGGDMRGKQSAAILVVNKEATEIVSDKEVNGEASFWVGITLAGENDTKEAIKYLKRAYKQDVRWAELVERLPEAKLLPDDPALIKKLLKGMKK